MVIVTDSATLRVLDISENDIKDDGIEKISNALKCNKSLTELMVVNCQISAKGSVCIAISYIPMYS